MDRKIIDEAKRLRQLHPLGYALPRDRGFLYWCCPKCEETSPCGVRILCDCVDPSGAQTRQEFADQYYLNLTRELPKKEVKQETNPYSRKIPPSLFKYVV